MRDVAFVGASYVEAHNSANRNLCIQCRLHYPLCQTSCRLTNERTSSIPEHNL